MPDSNSLCNFPLAQIFKLCRQGGWGNCLSFRCIEINNKPTPPSLSSLYKFVSAHNNLNLNLMNHPVFDFKVEYHINMMGLGWGMMGEGWRWGLAVDFAITHTLRLNWNFSCLRSFSITEYLPPSNIIPSSKLFVSFFKKYNNRNSQK